MPSRFIRDRCCRSESLHRLSDFAERLWWRLISIADDYGRFPAHPLVVLGACFPLAGGARRWVRKITHALAELEHEHVELYEVRGLRYGRIRTWREHQGHPRAKKSRYPPPPGEAPAPPDGIGCPAALRAALHLPQDGRSEGGGLSDPAPRVDRRS